MGRHQRDVVDVAREQQCPARDAGLPHEIKAGPPGPGRPPEDPVWQCWHCRVPWVDLDAAVRPDRPTPEPAADRAPASRPQLRTPKEELARIGGSESAVRAWAQRRGLPVAPIGRVASHLIQAYIEEHTDE